MRIREMRAWPRLRARAQAGAKMLVLVPLACLAADHLLGVNALRGLALVIMCIGVLLWLRASATAAAADETPRAGLVARLDGWLAGGRESGRRPAAAVLGLDAVEEIEGRIGPAGLADLRGCLQARLAGALRGDDMIRPLEDGTLAVALAPTRRFDLETLLQLAGRMQAALADPVPLDKLALRVRVSVGLCGEEQLPGASGPELLAAAEAAMVTARRAGPGAIRVYARAMREAPASRRDLERELSDAFDRGEIVAWFQPQLSTETGAVSGFEALARWRHPRHGLIPPPEFLPAVTATGRSRQLTDAMLGQAAQALRGWDQSGFRVPSVAVNFSAEDLSDPGLADRVLWHLDRFDLAPDRFTAEILETVIAESPDAVAVRNIARLAEAGCGIDLDDFGTGHASITSLRRFAVTRIKIDRSFVCEVDSDPSQQQMVAAILSMAERLGLATIAEGVETPEQHARLAELGCGHVQGFGIARPMPVEETGPWIARHPAPRPRLANLPRRLH